VVLAVGAAIVLVGCGADSEPRLRSSSIELSDGLAFRDGEPSIVIVSPTDGSLVSPTVRLKVEARNIQLVPAGKARDGQGHLHVFTDQDCMPTGALIEGGGGVIDVADGRSEIELTLAPGRHEICVQVGDGYHTAVAVTDRISITVADPSQ
jgi:hypothetical protein